VSTLVERVGNRVTVLGTPNPARARHYAGRLIGAGEMLGRGKRFEHPSSLNAFRYPVRSTVTEVPRSTCPLHGETCATWETLGAGA
jgi:hypothetical protein